MKYYILGGRDGHQPIAVDLHQWAIWMEDNRTKRHVADETFNGVRISTVFLGLDHNHFGDGPPLLFETMVFSGALNESMERYSTWIEAEEGHAKWRKHALEQQ